MTIGCTQQAPLFSEVAADLGWAGELAFANIRETDAIAHVVRCFEDPNVIHVAGKVDPVSDIETINTELALADLERHLDIVLRDLVEVAIAALQRVDLLLAGNFDGVKPEIGRMSASVGLFLRGDGTGAFTPDSIIAC